MHIGQYSKDRTRKELRFLFLHFPLLTNNTSIFYFSYLPEIVVSLILHKKYMHTKAGSPIFKQTGQNEAQTDIKEYPDI